MSGIGSGYDLYPTTFSPEGKIFQVEYAVKAAENSGTVVGVRVKDGVVLGVENLIRSKMLESGACRRIFNIAPHLGLATAGLLADSRQIANRARAEAASYKNTFGTEVPTKMVNKRLSSFIQMYTLSGAVRPFGCSAIIAGFDKSGPQLYMVDPSGVSFGYFGAAVGKGKQQAKNELEKLDFSNLTAREAVLEVAKIIYAVHDDVKDKEFELEMSWICEESNRKHQRVPTDLLQQAIKEAKALKDGDSDDEMND